MKITEEMLKARDKNGNLINFVFCSKCVKFYDLDGCKDGDEFCCQSCGTGKYLIGWSFYNYACYMARRFSRQALGSKGRVYLLLLYI